MYIESPVEYEGETFNTQFDESLNVTVLYRDNETDSHLAGASVELLGLIGTFDENGNQLWNKLYFYNKSKIFSPTSITTDANGNIYVSGIQLYGITNIGWWIKKFDSSGNEDILNWNISFNVEGISDQPKSIVTDKDNNVYVAGFGTHLKNITYQDWWIMKFDSFGNRIWEKIYDGDGFDDAIWSATVDNNGHLYVAGYGTHLKGITYHDWWIRKIID